MRKFVTIVALAAMSLSWSDLAHAGKKSEPAGDSAAAGTAYVMELTGVAELDAFFAKAQAPLDTLVNARTQINSVNTSLVSALGLKEGTPFTDALADLKAKGEGHISVAMDGAMPKLAVADAAPANVKAAVDSTNKAFSAAGSAIGGLSGLPDQFNALITEGKGLADPEKLKGMVANPTQLPKALTKSSKNLSTLGKAKDEPEMLKTSATALVSDTMAAFK